MPTLCAAIWEAVPWVPASLSSKAVIMGVSVTAEAKTILHIPAFQKNSQRSGLVRH